MSQHYAADILIVDDTPANLALLENILGRESYHVRALTDGQMAIRSAQNNPPDLILLDIKMPEMDGYEVCAALKADNRTAAIPVIFISALQETDDKVRAFNAGGVDYVPKPFQTEEVLARVKTHLHLRYLQTILQSTNTQLHTLLSQHQRILNTVGEGIFGLDSNCCITFMNPKALEQFGYALPELLGVSCQCLTHHRPIKDADSNAESCPIVNIAQHNGTRFIPLDHFYRKNGTAFPVEYTISSTLNEQEENIAIVVFRDISEQLHTKQQLEEAAAVFEVSSESILLTDGNGIISRINPAFSELTGYQFPDVIGKTPRILRSGHHDQAFYAELWGALHDQGRWEGEIWNRHKDGSICPKWQMITAIRDEQGEITGYVAQYSDVTRRKLTEEEIRYRGNYDALTGLVNRYLLLERFEQALKEHRRKNLKLSLLFIDLDRFKQVNDALGHTIGDLLLQQVARRIQHETREIDTAARLGGDEFVVMLTEQQDQLISERVASRLIEMLGEPYQVEGHDAQLGASIGIAMFPDDGDNIEVLLRNADLAMYRAKENGRQQVQFFTDSMETEFLRRSHLEAELRLALERNELLMYYQPIVDLQSGLITGVESLIRWQHPRMGLIAPDNFVAIAEETGLINPIGTWVLETVCRQLAEWNQRDLDLYASVNVSAYQIPRKIAPDWLYKLVTDNGLEPRQLVLEITESVFVKDVNAVATWLREVRAMGFRVYLDDFGTGYSSLSYLKSFPVDAVKIDQAFVREVAHHGSDQALVRAIVAMSEGLGLKVVAEGIETAAQISILREFNCPYGQGYLFSKPISSIDLDKILNNSMFCHNG